MARPTEEKKDRIVKLRVSDELYSELVKKGPNLSETIRKILKGESSVPQKTVEFKNDQLKEIESMALLSDMSLDDALREVVRLMDEGVLMLTGERIEVDLPEWATRFDEACHDRGLPTERVAESAIKAIQKGML